MRKNLTINSRARGARLLAQYVDHPRDEQQTNHDRPKTRGECSGGPRPCPWVSCRHHLYLDMNAHGSLILNRPGQQVDELEESCALDVADRGEQTLDGVGKLLGLTRERTRQIEEVALKRLNHLLRFAK